MCKDTRQHHIFYCNLLAYALTNWKTNIYDKSKHTLITEIHIYTNLRKLFLKNCKKYIIR